MLENLLNDLRIFDAGNHFDVTAAVFADFNINIEDSLEALHPGHGAVALCRTLVTPVSIETFRFVGLLAPLGGCYLNSVFAVRCKDAVEACEVDSRLRYQRSEFGDEVQRLEDHMGGAIAVRSFELVTHLPIGG
ncbi:hypothetical protein A7R77_33065 [Pseudomonas aeruginosa]|nr:hypothetical protein A7R77_33065 [Pseudomonas aeruginosa]OES51298.1 hypothetical protein A7R78_34100 [Pseudomonas aeruginosa]WNL65360.1 hypothetical protein GPGIFMOB_00311 [Acinetobacter gerneri]WOE61779.1 hypothetical protein PA12_pgene52 [Pseudomonas aeruginosa]